MLRDYRRGGLLRHLIRDIYWDRPPRPFAELQSMLTAGSRGVPTLEVLGASVTWTVYGCYRGMLITREAAGFVEWWQWLQTTPPAAERRSVAKRVASAIQTMHACGVQHADLNLTNILVRVDGPEPAALIIDFDRAHTFAASLTTSRRRRNLLRLHRSMQKLDPDGRFFPFEERELFFHP